MSIDGLSENNTKKEQNNDMKLVATMKKQNVIQTTTKGQHERVGYVNMCVIWVSGVLFYIRQQLQIHDRKHCRSCWPRVLFVGNCTVHIYYYDENEEKGEELQHKGYLFGICMHACRICWPFHCDDIAHVMDFDFNSLFFI